MAKELAFVTLGGNGKEITRSSAVFHAVAFVGSTAHHFFLLQDSPAELLPCDETSSVVIIGEIIGTHRTSVGTYITPMPIKVPGYRQAIRKARGSDTSKCEIRMRQNHK
ncbi:MAG: hypothetical protein CMH81_05170 [Nitrospiraceae bacterium]|nr:hypothetical protein [Nitrospiraceae bacterium]